MGEEGLGINVIINEIAKDTVRAFHFLSVAALCIAVVLISGCSECTTCTAGSPVPTVTPSAVPTVEVLEFNGFTMFRNPATKTACIEYPVPLELPSGPITDDPHAYDTELALAASQLQSTFFGENATNLLDGYTVTRLQAPVTNAGQPLAEIQVTGANLSDVQITLY